MATTVRHDQLVEPHLHVPKAHIHDDRYFTEAEVTALVNAVPVVPVTVGLVGSAATFVCDGVADQVQIAQAMTLAQLTSREVSILPGTYIWSAQIIFHDRSNITVRGAGLGKTIIKRTQNNALSMLDVGSGSGPTVRSNVTIGDLTFDFNRVGSGFGLAVPWCRNVLIDRVAFINPSSTMKAALLVGKFGGGSDAFEAENITLRDCLFDHSGVNISWEYVGIINAKNVLVDNCTMRGDSGQTRPAMLSYNSEQVRFVNCFLDHTRLTVGGRGTYSVVNTHFESSLLFCDQTNKIFIGGGTTFRSRGETTGFTNGIQFKGGYKTMADPETPWYVTEDVASTCENVVIDGVIFTDCKDNAIRAKTTTESGVETLDVRDLTITNCKFDGATLIPIIAFAERLTMIGNEVINANTSNIGSGNGHFYVAAIDLYMAGNYAKSANVTTDILVDQERFSTLIPTMNMQMTGNRLGSTTNIRYYNSAGTLVATKSPNVTINGVRSLTASATISSADETILADATAGAITVTLPVASSFPSRTIYFKKTDASANAITIDGSGSETIDGNLTISLDTQYLARTLQSDGTKWHII